jgi:hypothetical protein
MKMRKVWLYNILVLLGIVGLALAITSLLGLIAPIVFGVIMVIFFVVILVIAIILLAVALSNHYRRC